MASGLIFLFGIVTGMVLVPIIGALAKPERIEIKPREPEDYDEADWWKTGSKPHWMHDE